MKKRGFNIKVLIICLIIVYLVAFIGGISTSFAVNSDWYQTIKPSITPPNYIFPIVWNILFFMITIVNNTTSFIFKYIALTSNSVETMIIV